MDNVASDFFNIFRFLLPGFLAAWVFYGLSAYERPQQFERLIQAFIFTLVVQFLVAIFTWLYAIQYDGIDSAGRIPIYLETIVSVLGALIVGLLFALMANKDWLHAILRKLRLTSQTSYPSVWFGLFTTRQRFIVLHLKDERRLYGWPKEWPQFCQQGHFFIMNAAWMYEDKNGHHTKEIGVEGILLNVEDVKWVEFIESEN